MLNATLRNTYEYAELSKAYRDARKHKSTSLRAIDAARRVASPHAATKDIAGLNSYLGLLRSMQSYYLRRTLCNIARKNPLIRCDAAFTKIFTQHS